MDALMLKPAGCRHIAPRFATAAALVIAVATLATIAHAQELAIATRAAPLSVILLWTPDSATPGVRYNVYRRIASDAAWPRTPINASPLAPVTSCSDFRAIVPEGSDDWNVLARAFADSVTGALLTNVCEVSSYAVGSDRWRRLQVLARARPSIARVLGQGYVDAGVTAATAYRYQIRRVTTAGVELPAPASAEASMTAGAPPAIAAPSHVRIVAGDARLQILWDKPSPSHALFVVYRSTTAAGGYRRVNDAEFSTDITRDLDSNLVTPAANGFTDYERWDSNGAVQPRGVAGVPGTFTGPANGVTYYYRVALVDIAGNVGTQSAPVSAVAVDRTPPATPLDVAVVPLEGESHFLIRWPKIVRDANGHLEQPAHYRVYRLPQGSNPTDGAIALPGTVQHPTDSTIHVSKIDSGAMLRSPCRDSSHFFRVEAIDSAGNVSNRSVAVSGALKDTTRPEVVRGTTAEGASDHITIRWKLNDDCDIGAYLIYRAYCDFGRWSPCVETTPRDLKRQTAPPDRDCGGPFTLLGVLPHSEARSRADGDRTWFEDRTLDPSSPLCYAYIVKAQDLSQNVCGSWPIPDTTKEIIVCERLRDDAPPDPAIISGLLARDSTIRIEFIGPPVQDIAAYHVYRSEDPRGPFEWVGGVRIVPPPDTGHALTSPYKRPDSVGCATIPLVSVPYMSAAAVIDRRVRPKTIYWYKAVGIDQSGNEAGLDSAIAVSTFTFKSNRPAAPTISSIGAVSNPCGINIRWTPAFDASSMRGFAVFRSRSVDGPWLQVDNIVQADSFTDRSVARNVTYWYRIALLRADGELTNLSGPRSAAAVGP